MTTTTASITGPISHREAHGLALEAYERFAAVAAGLGPGDWSRPTDCEGWTIRDLVGHMVGAMRSAASTREMFRQLREIKRRAKATGQSETDVMTALQVEITAGLTTDELVAECRALSPRAAAGRRRIPAPARRLVRIPVEMGSIRETWSLGYLVDVVLTRDAWLHRIDLCRAAGIEPELTPGHDGRLVADVVVDWARRHGHPYQLVLTGPAGGEWSRAGGGAETIELDAVDFCRILSGRATGDGLLRTEVPF